MIKLAKHATAVDKIILARTFEECSSWGLEAFNAMTERTHPVTLEEGHRLGVDDVIFIGELRHVIHVLEKKYHYNILPAALIKKTMVQRTNIIELYQHQWTTLYHC